MPVVIRIAGIRKDFKYCAAAIAQQYNGCIVLLKRLYAQVIAEMCAMT